MSEKRTFFLVDRAVLRRAFEAAEVLVGSGWKLTLQEVGRTLDQNAAQWPYLDAFSKQLRWPVNGEMVQMEPEEWKDVLTAAFQGETVRLARGLNGGVVMLGMRTSKMGKRRFSEWLEFLKAVAAERSVEVYPEDVPA